ncbi:MAG: hypothetical protein ACJ72S_17670 [Nitrososphaeraceae archaeon]
MKFMSVYRLYYTNGDLNRRKIPRKRFVNIASKEGKEEKEKFKKMLRKK